MAMAHQLPGAAPCWRDTETEHGIVQTRFAKLEQHLTGDATLAGSHMVHLLELALEDAICVFRLLLLAELDGVFALLLAPAGIGSVLAGAVGLALHPLVRSIDRLFELAGDPGLGSCV